MKGMTGQRKGLRRGNIKDEKDENRELWRVGRETKKHTEVKPA